jgi:hypothetical protein
MVEIKESLEEVKKGKEIVNEVICRDVAGNKIPVDLSFQKRRISILSNIPGSSRYMKHVAGGYPYQNWIVTVAHCGKWLRGEFKVGEKVYLLIRECNKICCSEIVAWDVELDLLILKKPQVDVKGNMISYKCMKHAKSAPELGSTLTLFYENESGEEKVSSGRVGEDTQFIGFHDASTERGASGEPIILNAPGNPVIGIHTGVLGGRNRYIPFAVVNSFLRLSAQSSDRNSGQKN